MNRAGAIIDTADAAATAVLARWGSLPWFDRAKPRTWALLAVRIAAEHAFDAAYRVTGNRLQP